LRPQLRPRRTLDRGRSDAVRDRTHGRRPRRDRQLIPLTLIPLATAASQAAAVRSFAAALIGTCHAQVLRRFAEQIATGLSAAAAVAAWPTVPPPLLTFAEITQSTAALATAPWADTAWAETPVA